MVYPPNIPRTEVRRRWNLANCAEQCISSGTIKVGACRSNSQITPRARERSISQRTAQEVPHNERIADEKSGQSGLLSIRHVREHTHLALGRSTVHSRCPRESPRKASIEPPSQWNTRSSMIFPDVVYAQWKHQTIAISGQSTRLVIGQAHEQ